MELHVNLHIGVHDEVDCPLTLIHTSLMVPKLGRALQELCSPNANE